MAEMGTAHIVYIPGVLLVGLVVGWILGQRAALSEIKRRQLKWKE
jgi:hypothetical protein